MSPVPDHSDGPDGGVRALGAPTRMLAHDGGSLAGKLSADESSTSANDRSSIHASLSASGTHCVGVICMSTSSLDVFSWWLASTASFRDEPRPSR